MEARSNLSVMRFDWLCWKLSGSRTRCWLQRRHHEGTKDGGKMPQMTKTVQLQQRRPPEKVPSDTGKSVLKIKRNYNRRLSCKCPTPVMLHASFLTALHAHHLNSSSHPSPPSRSPPSPPLLRLASSQPTNPPPWLQLPRGTSLQTNHPQIPG